jgi:hypothetical protein
MKPRTIKFKGKRTDNDQWIYGTLIIDYGRSYIFDPVIRSLKEVFNSTVCQFSGLYDKDGTEIYEDDLYEANGIHYKVYFINGAFCGGREEKFAEPLSFEIDEDSDGSSFLKKSDTQFIRIIGNTNQQ